MASVTIFGQSLPNDGVLGTNTLTTPISIVNPTTLFDLSGLTSNHEAPVALYTSTSSSIASAVTYVWTWYRERDNTEVFTKTFSLSAPPSGQVYNVVSVYGWIGWLADDVDIGTYPQYKEIQENGDYHAVLTASGGENFTSSPLSFSVTGIPTSLAMDSSSPTEFGWTARLSNYFDSSNYISAGVCTSPFTDGQSSAPSGILGSNTAPASNVGCATSGTVTGANNGIIYGFAQAANGLYYNIGSFNYDNARPLNYEWDTPKVSGANFNISSIEWNRLTDRITQFRNYAGLSYPKMGWTTAPYADGKFYAFMYNQAVVGVAGGHLGGTDYTALPHTIAPPPQRNSGDEIVASEINTLRDSLNSVS
jgi:hypothetical protein